ncbi:MAG: efflux transporter outer membrane subunit [Pseudomonas sp.]|jgi:NodT family efflux transporter outer membrane factor (OMF) lipoprotein|nr:efflux transporter outer membrane subunit [Pseudomonas sp.]MDY0415268.1 efflux transporter outer membrane subunit [Pseudomonas sp.]NLO52921.1 efflux transporter outer membrane subunit [Gammaproteobacteria bacterium]
MKPIVKLSLLALAGVLLSGCALGPDYQRPEAQLPLEFRHTPGWKVAQPAELGTAVAWWSLYQDATLADLLQQLNTSNQNLRAAEAAWREARALVGGTRSGLYPNANGQLGTARSGNDQGVGKSNEVALGLSWQLDIWGQVRRQVESSEASAQASAAEWAGVRLSQQSELVQNYLQLRVIDEQIRLLDATVIAYQRSLQLTENRYTAGMVTRADVSQALTQLRNTEAQRLDLDWQRARYEHAIALLVGSTPNALQVARVETLPALPALPIAVPSALLERRPDIAAAERRVMAANADIGVAQTAYFPDLTLSASGGYRGSNLADWITMPNRFWSMGPQFAMTLFDAGLRRSKVEQAEARYDQQVARYRQTTLQAIGEVEDALVQLNVLAEEIAVQREALAASQDSLQLTENQYAAGMVDYLAVSSAQTTALNSERSLLNLLATQLKASAQLISALGGGWDMNLSTVD